MKTIYKYQLTPLKVNPVLMPVGAEILTAQSQNNLIQLWAVVDPDEKRIVTRHFVVIGTGWPFGDDTENLKYISTAQLNNGSLVFHIFESI